MPELPEVEALAARLHHELRGRKILGTTVHRATTLVAITPANFASALRDAVVERVARRGKFLLFSFSVNRTLIVHLRMQGHFHLASLGEPLRPHTDISFDLSDHRRLDFIDTRHLAKIMLAATAEVPRVPAIHKLGCEPLDEKSFTVSRLAELLASTRRPLKIFLLDQTRISGIGNIYASEILFRARLNPRRRTRALSNVEKRQLFRAIRSVLQHAVRRCVQQLAAVNDLEGWFQEVEDFARVYGREGKPCPRCRCRLRRMMQAQRSTFFCPRCQR